ncbi:MAG: ice-binding family protein [Candidatus Dormiibacterota bacterium]
MTTHQKYEVGGGHRWYVACLGLAAVAIWVTVGVLSVAAATTVNLGRATPFAVLAGTTVTNTGPSTVAGSLGVDPGSAVTGFPPGTVSDGTIQAADAVALGAQDDLTTAYGQAAGEGPPTAEGADLGGDTLVPGVYQSSTPDGPLALTGTLTLNGAGVYIFQTGSTLTANTDSTVVLEGGASACDVFWQVGSQATLNGPTFVGTVMANTTIAVGSSVTVDGRLLAQTAAVTLIDDTINASACFTAASTTPSTTTPVTGAAGLAEGTLLAISGLALLGAGVASAAIRRRRGAARPV